MMCLLLPLLLLACSCAFSHTFVAPLMEQSPVLDGKPAPGEWRRCVTTMGMAWEGQLERRNAWVSIGATADALQVSVVSQLPDEGKLQTDVDVDTLKVVYDDSIEVWVDPTPGAEHGKTYQLIFNSAGHKGFKMHARGNATEDVSWAGDWRMANSVDNAFWACEVTIPLAGIAPGRRADQGSWGINVCRNWKNPWGFSSIGGGGYAPTDVTVSFGDAPAVGTLYNGDPASGDLHFLLSVSNPGQQPVTLQTQMLLTRDVMPEVNQQETVTLEAGQRKLLELKLKDESTKRFGLATKVTSADGKTVYYDRSYAWKATPAFVWKTAQALLPPLDCQFAYYPYLNEMRLLVDVSGLAADSVLEHVQATVRGKDGKTVKSVKFDQFEKGKQEQTLRLPELEGSYEIALKAVGQKVPEGETVKPFERTRYEWEHNKLGRSEKVYPPFTPLRVAGNKVSCVLREHAMNAQGLWDQVQAAGGALLARPMGFTASVGGKTAPVQAGTLQFARKADNEVVANATLKAGALAGQARCTWDYDGVMRVDLTLKPSAAPVEALTLDIPLRNDQATMLHAMGDGIRNTLYQKVPEGQGVVWSAEKVAVNDFPRNFCSYIYVGTPVRGLCWFAENDAGWGWDRKVPNLELVRQGDELVLRVHLINQPTTITQVRTITFGLQAAPVKPRLEPWRHQWWRGKYTLLGTDINWFALGNCGSVYPAGKEMYFWEMLKRGNKEQLSAEEINKVADYGRHYYEPYGPDMVETWNRHVQHNLRARYAQQMVLYYNRASYQLADEFQTFEDEWSLTDHRTVGPGKGIGEIKVVPSESYIDHALYWYGKSFDVADNRGVYWDNMFFCADYNTRMSAAYRQADGSVMPATGLWGLRELTKRTFVYMNERGMPPITMSHMTSTGLLPMLSFCTVQYDWEWKYSEGDVHYRFPREYILLVSNGDLAGTWPVLLGDQGKLGDDPWTQRTYAGVALVHEMTPSGVHWPVWKPLVDPILALLEDKTLQVYRYWDERPQPVTSGNGDLPLIVYSVPGKEAIVLVTNYAEEDLPVTLTVEAAKLGLTSLAAVDVESGAEVPVVDGKIALPLKKHDVCELRLRSR